MKSQIIALIFDNVICNIMERIFISSVSFLCIIVQYGFITFPLYWLSHVIFEKIHYKGLESSLLGLGVGWYNCDGWSSDCQLQTPPITENVDALLNTVWIMDPTDSLLVEERICFLRCICSILPSPLFPASTSTVPHHSSSCLI